MEEKISCPDLLKNKKKTTTKKRSIKTLKYVYKLNKTRKWDIS